MAREAPSAGRMHVVIVEGGAVHGLTDLLAGQPLLVVRADDVDEVAAEAQKEQARRRVTRRVQGARKK